MWGQRSSRANGAPSLQKTQTCWAPALPERQPARCSSASVPIVTRSSTALHSTPCRPQDCTSRLGEAARPSSSPPDSAEHPAPGPPRPPLWPTTTTSSPGTSGATAARPRRARSTRGRWPSTISTPSSTPPWPSPAARPCWSATPSAATCRWPTHSATERTSGGWPCCRPGRDSATPTAWPGTTPASRRWPTPPASGRTPPTSPTTSTRWSSTDWPRSPSPPS